MAKELGKRKYRHRKTTKSTGQLEDFDRFGNGSPRNEIMDVTTDINGNGSKLPEIATGKGAAKASQSFVLMPVGANRKKLRQTSPIQLSKFGQPVRTNRGMGNSSMEESEVENPVLVSNYKKKNKKTGREINPTSLTYGYNMDLEPVGGQT